VSNVTWITISSGQSGQGDAAVHYAVAANKGEERSGTITVAGRDVTITQARN
jgi:hypothetical protein